MYSYIFVLGRNFLLSSAEIFSVLNALKVKYKVINNSLEALLIETQAPLQINILQQSLGGTIEIGELENIVTRDIGKKIRREADLIKVNVGDNYIALAKKVTEQDVENFRVREFDKPFVDTKSGQLSVKLALIMTNLAIQSDTTTIYDPFCGSGSINIEAVRLGFNTIGTDIDSNAIIGSRKNMEWYRKEIFDQQSKFPSYHFYQCDVQTASSKLIENEFKVDAIVTEGYLGKPRTRPIAYDKSSRQDLDKVSDLIERSLVEYRKILKKGQRVVTVIPIYRTRESKLTLPVRDKIENLGYNTVDLFGKSFDFCDKRNELIIFRRGSFVLREIFVLEIK